MAHFKHDCEACISLGEFKGADLYTCLGQSLVARFSSDGPDYTSIDVFMLRRLLRQPKLRIDPHLREAYKRVLERADD